MATHGQALTVVCQIWLICFTGSERAREFSVFVFSGELSFQVSRPKKIRFKVRFRVQGFRVQGSGFQGLVFSVLGCMVLVVLGFFLLELLYVAFWGLNMTKTCPGNFEILSLKSLEG